MTYDPNEDGNVSPSYDCTRCNNTMAWEGDRPESEEECICNSCLRVEVEELRAENKRLKEERQHLDRRVEHAATRIQVSTQKLLDAVGKVVAAAEDQVVQTCWCFYCLHVPAAGVNSPAFQHLIVCPTCGNKRCPKATNHRFECTASNDPGQPGSLYGGAP